MSPDGEAIVTGAGDETLRFWNVFSKMRSTKVQADDSDSPVREPGLWTVRQWTESQLNAEIASIV